MKEKEAVALLQLQSSKGIGSRRGKQLLDRFGSAQRVVRWAESNRRSLPHWAQDLVNPGAEAEAKKQWQLSLSEGFSFYGYGQERYPKLLTELPDPPLLFFVEGKVDLSREVVLSVVGTRRMTSYGAGFCKELIQELSEYNPLIVSGFAEGIDITVQMEAVKAGLSTLACLAHGLDHVYPAFHRIHRKAVLERGGFMTEYWYDQKAKKSHFVQRNRLIAGLSPATLVVQSGEKGGSLLTAELAQGYHREVFALPGRNTDAQNRGCLNLIRDHMAQALYRPQDLVEFLGWERSEVARSRSESLTTKSAEAGLSKTEQSILDYLQKNGKTSLYTFIHQAILPRKRLLEVLLDLELEGYVRSQPGQYYELS